MNKFEVKKKLLDICIKELESQIELLKDAMEKAQKEADHHKGAMASRYDTFKEEAQALRDGYARQLYEKAKIMPNLTNMNPEITYAIVKHGSIVETNNENYFMSAFIVNDPIEVNGKRYLPISINSPLGQRLEGMRKGDEIESNERIIRVLDVY